MTLDWQAIRGIADALVVVGLVVNSVYTWYSNQRKAERAEVADLRERVIAAERLAQNADERIQSTRQFIDNHLPSKDDVHGLSTAITQLSGEVKVLTARADGDQQFMKRVDSAITRVENYLLTKGDS